MPRTSLLRKHWLTLFLAVLVVYSIVRFGILAVRLPGMIPNDYTLYHATCDRLWAGEPVYRYEDDSPFKYSPTFMALFCNTFGLPGKHAAWPIFAGLSILAFALAMRRIWLWAFGGKIPPFKEFAPVLVPAIVFGWHGYLEQYAYGQVDFLMFAAFTFAAWLSEDKRRSPLAALLLGLMLITKPQMGLLLAYFLIRRDWRTLTLTAASTLILLLLPAPFWGWTKHVAFHEQWRIGLSKQSALFMTGNHNQSLAASIARLAHQRELVFPLTQLFIALATAAVVVATWFGSRRKHFATAESRARLFCWVVLLYLLASPLSWRWITFVWMPIASVLALDALRSRDRTRLALLGLFAIVGLLLQQNIAHAIGINEIDELSFAGMYALGSTLLFVACTLTLKPR